MSTFIRAVPFVYLGRACKPKDSNRGSSPVIKYPNVISCINDIGDLAMCGFRLLEIPPAPSVFNLNLSSIEVWATCVAEPMKASSPFVSGSVVGDQPGVTRDGALTMLDGIGRPKPLTSGWLRTQREVGHSVQREQRCGEVGDSKTQIGRAHV